MGEEEGRGRGATWKELRGTRWRWAAKRWKNTGKQERCNVQCLDDVPCLPEQEEDI